MILDLIGLLDKHGLIHGAGERPEEFCVQQAVNRVIHGDLNGQYSDNPKDCIHSEIRAFGVRLNDCTRDIGRKARAEALKRFSIAQLGSLDINSREFMDGVAALLGMDSGSDIIDDHMMYNQHPEGRTAQLKHLADTAAQVLKEMGTEGSKFLYILDEPSKKAQIKEARKLGKQIYAAQMADFGTTGCAVKPKQQQ